MSGAAKAAAAQAPAVASPQAPQVLPSAPAGSLSRGAQFRQLLAGLTLTACVKALCIFGNVLWQVSPWPQVVRWNSRCCTGEADAAPYVSIAFGGWQWCSYGTLAYYLTKRSGFLILVHANLLGAMLGTWYVVSFYRNCRHDDAFETLRRYLGTLIAVVLFQVLSVLVLPSVRALFLVGLVSSTCSFLGALAMLVPVPQVLRTKDSRSIPGPVVLAGFLCSIAWVACGILLSDPLVTGPNMFAGSACGLCLYLKFAFPSSAGLEDDDAAKAVEGGALIIDQGFPSQMTPLARAARLAAS